MRSSFFSEVNVAREKCGQRLMDSVTRHLGFRTRFRGLW